MTQFFKKLSLFLFITITAQASFSQNNYLNCEKFKNGRFYYYNKYSGERWLMIRQGDLQKEVRIDSADTAFYKINWESNCVYTLEYLSGKISNESKTFYNYHKTIVKIFGTYENSYAFRTYADEITEEIVGDVDTFFVNPKPSNYVFKVNFIEAHFPGGEEAWTKYITDVLYKHIKILSKDGKSGTCLVKFIVDVDGSISDVKAINMKDSKLAKTSIEAIKNGPKWIAGTIDGKPFKAYREQPVTLNFQQE